MKKKLSFVKILAPCFGAFVILFFLFVLCLPWFFSTNPGKKMLISMISNRTGLQIQIEKLSLGWFSSQMAKKIQIQKVEEQLKLAILEIQTDSPLWKVVFMNDLGQMQINGPDLQMNKEGVAKLQFGAKSALFAQDSDSAQIAYFQSSMSICAESEPVQNSSNLASKASFATPSTEELYRLIQSLDKARAREILQNLSSQIEFRFLEEGCNISFKSLISDVELVFPSALTLPSFDESISSFTKIAQSSEREDSINIVPPLPNSPCSPHTLPFGSETGHLLHLLFEKIFKRRLHHPFNEKAIVELIHEELAFSPLSEWIPIMFSWISELLKKKLLHFSLTDIPSHQIQQEMEFLFPTKDGMMKGFCDLLFEFEDKYYLLDWKSNYLGPSDDDYTKENIIHAMHAHHYFLQASIYAAALQRFVKLFDNRPFSERFGGAIYYFIRGKAVLHFIPELYANEEI